MAGQGDEYLRGILGEGEYASGEQQVNVVGGGSAPGASSTTMTDIQDQIDRQRAAERERVANGEADGGWFSGIGTAMAAMPSGAGGGGYKFDPDVVDEKIRQFEDLRDKIRVKYEELLRAAEDCTPPSYDDPAVAQATAARESIIKAGDHNRGMSEYAQSYVVALRKANGTYQEKEEDTAGVFKEGGNGGDLPPGTGTLFQ